MSRVDQSKPQIYINRRSKCVYTRFSLNIYRGKKVFRRGVVEKQTTHVTSMHTVRTCYETFTVEMTSKKFISLCRHFRSWCFKVRFIFNVLSRKHTWR